MVRIYSSVSHRGGSTTAFINLTNALNEVCCETVFIGPHEWHLDKCNSELAVERKISFNEDDVLIIHLINVFRERPDVKKIIYSCHEQEVFPISKIQYNVFDKIHYVSEHQRKFHKVNHPSFILPNILEDLKPNQKPEGKIGGIVGSVDRNKQVDVSIRRALKDGCDKVYIYGMITDISYWESEVESLVDGNVVVYKDFEDDKQKIYDSVTDVYHSSKHESWGYIKGECELTNTIFHGNNSTRDFISLSKEEIVKRWLEEIEYGKE